MFSYKNVKLGTVQPCC